MSSTERLEARVVDLEREMPEVRKLAADASTEVSDMHARLRAHTKVLEALRTTQVEQGQEIRETKAELRDGFAKMDESFVQVNENFVQVNENFATVQKILNRMGLDLAQIAVLISLKERESGES